MRHTSEAIFASNRLSMAQTSIGLVIRHRACSAAMPPPMDSQNSVSIGRTLCLSIRLSLSERVMVGRDPVEHELMPEFLLWFEHGELEYPIFQCPSMRPPNAALKLSSRPMKIMATADEVLSYRPSCSIFRPTLSHEGDNHYYFTSNSPW